MKPLEDLRIIALEQYGAGPFGTLHLADLGADVIKIEDPRSGGDVGRYVPPFQMGEDSLFFETFNRNKRSISLDLENPAGREVFEDLTRRSDAVFSNFRGDVPKKLKIQYADLSHLNPAIVCVSLSGFGNSGPLSDKPSYDYMLQALAGWMSLTGEPEGPPTKSGLSLVDFTGGYVAAIALLSAVHAARRDGKGMDCDLSLYDVALTLLNYPATWYMTGGWEPRRTERSAHPSLVPFQLFKGSDTWFVVGCAKEKFWNRLIKVIGQPELAEDLRFIDFAARSEHASEVVSILDEVFAASPAASWVSRLQTAGVPVAPVRTVSEALDDPHTTARGLVVEIEHPRFGVIRSLASPVRVGDISGYTYRRAPYRNEHEKELLQGLLGYSDREIGALEGRGAFGAG
jgi:crotonobetainyl-CoA:carnitine CoA-transferase CaiB-like acyl-CoA transferase